MRCGIYVWVGVFIIWRYVVNGMSPVWQQLKRNIILFHGRVWGTFTIKKCSVFRYPSTPVTTIPNQFFISPLVYHGYLHNFPPFTSMPYRPYLHFYKDSCPYTLPIPKIYCVPIKQHSRERRWKRRKRE